MAGGVITAGIISGVGSLAGGLAGGLFGASDQANALKFQNAMANEAIKREQDREKLRTGRAIAGDVNQIFLAPEADITRQLAASKYKFGQGFDLEQAAESSAKARQATESMSPLQQSFANLLIQKNAEKERLGDSENNKLAAMFGPIGSGAALAGKYGLFGGGGAY
jgi:hypothetical protein